MACANPRTLYFTADGTRTPRETADTVRSFPVGCNQCALCRSAAAAELSVRLQHEGFMHKQSFACALTYADEHLPYAGSLSPRDLELFLKRLREKSARVDGAGAIRFNGIGEYSDRWRPHYHLIIFGWWPSDSVPAGKSQKNNREYSSELVESTWGKGRVTLQPFSSGAADYIAAHDAAKVAKDGPRRPRPVFDEAGRYVGQRIPEFRRASNKRGIGYPFFEQYGEQMLANGWTVAAGKRVPIPSYYLRCALPTNPARVLELIAERELMLWERRDDSTPLRLQAREACARARLTRGGRDGIA